MEVQMYNFVDVSGFGHSGKSVMIDLFKEIQGIQVPDYFFEFDLLRIPGGLADLKHNVYDCWSPIRSDAAIKRFENVAYRMGLESVYTQPLSKIKAYGTQYEKQFKNRFFEETRRYIDSLVISKSMKMEWPYLRIDESYWLVFLFKLLRKFSLDKYFPNKYLNEYCFVSPEAFVEKTQRYLNSLFATTVEGSDVDTIVLNNTFEPYYPEANMDLFPNSKCIVVSRDPRDIFASTMMPTQGFVPDFLKPQMHWKMKQSFLMADRLDAFIKNQALVNKSIKKTNSKRVLRLRYEDIVLAYEQTLSNIFDFLEIPIDKHVRKRKFFDPDKSKLNVGLWKHLHDQAAIRAIEQSLAEYCYQA